MGIAIEPFVLVRPNELISGLVPFVDGSDTVGCWSVETSSLGSIGGSEESDVSLPGIAPKNSSADQA